MFDQLFEESPMIQQKLNVLREKLQGQWYEQWREQMQEQVREQMQEEIKVETLQRILVDFVEVRFPDLTDFAQKQVKLLKTQNALETLRHQLFVASDATMVRNLLESVPE